MRSYPGLTFRPLTLDDAHELAYLELEIFTAPWSESSLRSCLHLPHVEGEAAVIGGAIIGYIFSQFAKGEAHLLNIGVRKYYRRQGIGRELLERFLKTCEKYESKLSFLEVRAKNRTAQQMYYQYGFMPLSVRESYYPDGEDALILVRYFDKD
ncbi:ribosomal protein S18-alanine N-acetyltransferase [bacterium]|nr:ribosomal protein S18-alanine N-acetyltransferase [bacterium]